MLTGCLLYMTKIKNLIMWPVLLIPVLLLTGCATPLPRSMRAADSGPAGNCIDFFTSLDHRVAEAGVMDSGDFRIKGYPYLRVNRFLASFQQEIMDKETFAAWINHMQILDQDAREYEMENLPTAAGQPSENNKDAFKADVVTCGNLLKTADFKGAGLQMEALRKQVDAPDEYSLLRRIFGLYPLSRFFILLGVDNWHKEARKNFSTQSPAGWLTIRYIPENFGELPSSRRLVQETRRDALGIPTYAPGDLEALFKIFAPAWEVQIQGDQDKIGSPFWTAEGKLGVNTQNPLTYTLLSFTRFGKDILTQLNYIIWFPSRPKVNALDIYGGLLDGVNYRVTLDNMGDPMLYETIHNCGCFYMAFPAKGLHVRKKIDYSEPPLILQTPEVDPKSEFMTIAMTSGAHFVQHLYPVARKTQSYSTVYSLADYGQLRSLPRGPNGRAGMFDQDGIGIGSERLERFLYWPTGILSPGSMRQWGRQAVAFAGTRHFDDPFFMDKIFTRSDD